MCKTKIKIFCLVIGLYILSFSLYAGDLGSVDGHAVVFEKGDIIYYKGRAPIVKKEGHAGIFYGWPYKVYGEPTSNREDVVEVNPIETADSSNSSQYATIEALAGGYPVSKSDIEDFLSRRAEFWGVRTVSLTRLQRTRIAETAKNQMGIPYRPYRGYKRPGGGLLDFQSFRCDGLVEYCYEQAGVDLVPGDTSNPIIAAFPGRVFLTPKNQMNSPLLSERTSASVEIVEIERVLQNGEEVEPDENDIYYVYDRPDVPDKVTIEVNVSDGDYGSGIRMTDFWVGAPDDTPDVFESNDSGKRIGIDNHTETVGGIYTANWDIDDFEPGEYTLHILAYDQAGNVGNVEIKARKNPVLSPYVSWIPDYRKYGKVWPEGGSLQSAFERAKADWGNIDTTLCDEPLALTVKSYFYAVFSLSLFPKANLTSYDPSQYYAELWFQPKRYNDDFDAHGSGFEETKWYKYPENPVVGTDWVGSIKYPLNNDPPNWNQPFESWDQSATRIGWGLQPKLYLFPK